MEGADVVSSPAHRAGWEINRRELAGLALAATAATAMPDSLSARTREAKLNNDNKTPLSRDELVKRLVKAGEALVAGAAPAEIASYFDTEAFRFHGPDGSATDFKGLNTHFASIRSAFKDRTIRRGIVIVEGNIIACQTFIEGTFVNEFTWSPVGPLPANGARVKWDLSNIFRFDDQGRLIEEFVRTDYRSFLRQLGAEHR